MSISDLFCKQVRIGNIYTLKKKQQTVTTRMYYLSEVPSLKSTNEFGNSGC